MNSNIRKDDKIEQAIMLWLGTKGKEVDGKLVKAQDCLTKIPENVIVYFKNVHYVNTDGDLICIE